MFMLKSTHEAEVSELERLNTKAVNAYARACEVKESLSRQLARQLNAANTELESLRSDAMKYRASIANLANANADRKAKAEAKRGEG